MNRREVCIGAGLGAALALAGVGHRHPALPDLLPRARPLRWWLADRARGRVWGLDAELFVRATLDVHAPVAVAADAGGLWVASARDLRRAGPHDLLRIDARGATRARHALGPVHALTAGSHGDARIVAEVAGRGTRRSVGRLLACTGAAPPLVRAELPTGATFLARRPGELLVGAEWGELWLLEDGPRGCVLRAGAFVAEVVAGQFAGGALRAVAPARAGWWALAERRLTLVDRALDVVCERRVDFVAACLAVAADGGAWVFARDEPRLARFDRSGGWLFERARLCQRGFTAARSTRAGGVLAATPTALIELDARGALVRGQGGFDSVCALAPAWQPRHTR